MSIKTLTRELAGYRVARRVALPSDKDYMLLCTNQAGEQKLAAWTLDEPHSASLEISLHGEEKPTAVSGNGEPFKPQIESGRLSLALGSLPQYVKLGKAVLK